MNLLAIDVVAFDAEQKQYTDPRVRDWLLKAKDVVFDAEDLLEEIDYEAKWKLSLRGLLRRCGIPSNLLLSDSLKMTLNPRWNKSWRT